MNKKKFPPVIYVKWEKGDEPYLMCHDSAEEALEAGETIRVATYELKEVQKGRLLPVLK